LPPEQLSPLDAAFLRLEEASAHMHIAMVGYFRPPAGERTTVEALRGSVEARLSSLPRFRQRLAWPPPGLGDPFWVDDPDFDIAQHVVAATGSDEAMAVSSFEELVDALLSEPLVRSRPLWEFVFVPRLEDGRSAILCRVHHAMVDGVAGMEILASLFSDSADARPEPVPPWRPPAPPGPLELAVSALARQAQAAGGLLSRGLITALSPPASAARAVRDALERAAAAVGNDVLFPAPDSFLNRPIGPTRRLVRSPLAAAELLAVKRATGVSFNDACLAVACGGLRRLALERGEPPAVLKVAIPVSMRGADSRGWGNRISFASIELPLDVASAGERVDRIHEQTQRFKRVGRAEATDTAINALALLPGPLRTPIARVGASARAFNLTISNVPGPRTPLYLLGAELDEGYLLAPLTPGHALSIAFFPYRDQVFFAGYADPVALPEVVALPEALSAELGELRGAVRPATRAAVRTPPDG
jgi:diacylglycerol O-acyltransferase / wax synthase